MSVPAAPPASRSGISQRARRSSSHRRKCSRGCGCKQEEVATSQHSKCNVAAPTRVTSDPQLCQPGWGELGHLESDPFKRS